MTAQPTDEELVRQVARGRDREAFNLLYERIKSPAFAVARSIAGQTALAEEAVQEAMLVVWLKSENFDRAQGSARSWILRVVANRTMHSARKLRSGERSELGAASKLVAEREAPPVCEAQELRHCLVRVLDGLPLTHRQVMVLYFAGGLSQQEIGRSLRLPQTTVSRRISQGLEEVRARLRQAGFAVLVPVADAERLGAALREGVQVPEGLTTKVLALPGSVAGSRSGPFRPRSGLPAFRIPAVLVLALAVLVAWRWLGEPPRTDRFSPDGERATQAGARVSNPVSRPGFHRKWVFDTPAPEDVFRVIRGSWTHVPPQQSGAPGYMLNKGPVMIELRLPRLRRPFAVFTNAGLPREGGSTKNEKKQAPDVFSLKVGPARSDILEFGVILNLCRKSSLLPQTFSWHLYRHIFARDMAEACVDGQRGDLAYLIAKEDAPLTVTIDGAHHIADVEIRELGERETPDFDAYRAAIQAIPKSRRTGLVPLPELKPLDSSRPVGVLFSGGLEPKPE